MTPPWPSKVDLLNPPKMNTCPKCRALLDPADKVCEYCGTSVKHLTAPSETVDLRRAMGIFTWILTVNFLMFMLAIALDRHQKEEGALSPSSQVLLAFGSNSATKVLEDGQYWRLVSSGFLHWDLLHLLMNSACLFILGSQAAHAFGANRAWVIYACALLTGGAFSLISGGNSAGASGAVCGLIAALYQYGRHRGGDLGRVIAQRMLTWAMLIAVVGALAPNIDNWGHAGGFLGGYLVGGYASRLAARGGTEDRIWWMSGVFCLLVVGVSLCFASYSAVLYTGRLG